MSQHGSDLGKKVAKSHPERQYLKLCVASCLSLAAAFAVSDTVPSSEIRTLRLVFLQVSALQRGLDSDQASEILRRGLPDHLSLLQ